MDIQKKLNLFISFYISLSSLIYAKDVEIESLGINAGVSHTYYVAQDVDVSAPDTNLINSEIYIIINNLFPNNNFKPTLNYIHADNDNFNIDTFFLGLNRYDTFDKFNIYTGALAGYSMLKGKYTPINNNPREDYSQNDFSLAIQAGLQFPLQDNIKFNINSKYLIHNYAIDLSPKQTAKFTHTGTFSILLGIQFFFSDTEKKSTTIDTNNIDEAHIDNAITEDYNDTFQFSDLEEDASLDSDNDGVSDMFDNCSNSVKGEIVDEFGCAKDSDDDSVFDRLDRCKNSIEDEIVDEFGCAKDSDRDGIIDRLDMCRNSIENEIVDDKGCPKDEDNDAVIDRLDKCLNSTEGAIVNDFGCEQNPTKKEVKSKIKKTMPSQTTQSLKPNYILKFAYKSNTLADKSLETIDIITQYLLDNKSSKILIKSYTDSIGSAKYNIALSKKRSDIIYKELLLDNIAKKRIMIENLGESSPIASNLYEAGREKNRRVEIYLITP